MFSRDSNSGIQCQFSGVIFRVKGFPTTKALCNANLEQCHGDQTFKHSEPYLEAPNDKFLESVSITCVQIHRDAI